MSAARSVRGPTTAIQFMNMFSIFGAPNAIKARELLAQCPDDELPNLLVALYKSGVPILPQAPHENDNHHSPEPSKTR